MNLKTFVIQRLKRQKNKNEEKVKYKKEEKNNKEKIELVEIKLDNIKDTNKEEPENKKIGIIKEIEQKEEETFTPSWLSRS